MFQMVFGAILFMFALYTLDGFGDSKGRSLAMVLEPVTEDMNKTNSSFTHRISARAHQIS